MTGDPSAGAARDLSRSLACGRCGTVFSCGLDGDCWCAAESFRLPLPAEGAGDCLCPDCLRRAASTPATV